MNVLWSCVKLLRYGWIALILLVLLAAVESAQDIYVSNQCDTETRILNNNIALQDAAPILQCNIDFAVSNNCTFDYDSLSKNYSNACMIAGGQFYTTNIMLDCNVNLGGQNYNGKSYYMNTPVCIGISCTGREIETNFESNIYPNLEKYYATQGVQCEISNSYAISILHHQYTLTWLVATTLTVALSLLD